MILNATKRTIIDLSTDREQGHWLEALKNRQTIYRLGAAMVNVLVIIDGTGPLADVKLHLSDM